MEKNIYFRAEDYKKYRRYEKSFKQDSFRIKFLTKNQWTHIFISPRSGARSLQRLELSKYYKVLEWESWLTLELNAAAKYQLYWKMSQTKIV